MHIVLAKLVSFYGVMPLELCSGPLCGGPPIFKNPDIINNTTLCGKVSSLASLNLRSTNTYQGQGPLFNCKKLTSLAPC